MGCKGALASTGPRLFDSSACEEGREERGTVLCTVNCLLAWRGLIYPKYIDKDFSYWSWTSSGFREGFFDWVSS